MVLNAQNNPKEISGIWEFQSITTVFNSEPKETISDKKDNTHRETMTIRDDDSFSFRGVYDGYENAGIGSWYIADGKIIFNVDGGKIEGKYTILNRIFTLIINDFETDEFYESNSVLKYKQTLIAPKI